MTTVQLSIAGRGPEDAPLLGDLLDQIQDFFEILNGVAASIAGDDADHFEWRVIGLSKNSPASITVEAIPLAGFSDGAELAARARDQAAVGLVQLKSDDARPVHFTDNVLEAADRFVRRIARNLSETIIHESKIGPVSFKPVDAIPAISNIGLVLTSDPIHPYRELGSFEGHIENVGTDGWGRPYIVIKSRLTDADVKCFLRGAALEALEQEPVAEVVWRKRRVLATGVLKFRSLGRLSQAEINRLDFSFHSEKLPQLADIIDPQFTGGLPSEEFLERLRNGET
ncbi:hypothetical protein ABS767_14555 [Sphingomonas sp. ST-64]|uniref:Uncharacterized protein n=1 Tax=Sphingomonas plantiphila TaxID=3163295 RepID=A0ABW8YSP6_9SPHN